MPSENFHVCDINTSLKVVGSQKRTHGGKTYTARIGLPKSGKGGSSDYAYYYPKDSWTAAQASAHCKEHKGTFEAAKKQTQEMEDKYRNPKTNPFIRTGEED